MPAEKRYSIEYCYCNKCGIRFLKEHAKCKQVGRNVLSLCPDCFLKEKGDEIPKVKNKKMSITPYRHKRIKK